LEQIKFQDIGGAHHNINYNHPLALDIKMYQKMVKRKLNKFLFFWTSFVWGTEVYHEFSVISEGMQKFYLVKQERYEKNKLYHIERLPGTYPGAMIDFTSTLKDHKGSPLKKPDVKNN
jgi:hypothetical protein